MHWKTLSNYVYKSNLAISSGLFKGRNFHINISGQPRFQWNKGISPSPQLHFGRPRWGRSRFFCEIHHFFGVWKQLVGPCSKIRLLMEEIPRPTTWHVWNLVNNGISTTNLNWCRISCINSITNGCSESSQLHHRISRKTSVSWISMDYAVKPLLTTRGLEVTHHSIPKSSMYGIFTYIWSIFMVNVGKIYHTLSVWDRIHGIF